MNRMAGLNVLFWSDTPSSEGFYQGNMLVLWRGHSVVDWRRVKSTAGEKIFQKSAVPALPD